MSFSNACSRERTVPQGTLGCKIQTHVAIVVSPSDCVHGEQAPIVNFLSDQQVRSVLSWSHLSQCTLEKTIFLQLWTHHATGIGAGALVTFNWTRR